MLRIGVIICIIIVSFSSFLTAETFDFCKLSDEVSFYANTDDDFNTKGRTLQIVALNSVKIGTWFQLEFTGDFNWDVNPGTNYDYYIEIGIAKPFWKNFSLNYQRIYGTFVDKPINQFGIRFSL